MVGGGQRSADCAMTDCTERHLPAPTRGIAGEGHEGMAKKALP
jgi:hypothetical protein